MPEPFSVTVIARNEAKTLPRLLASVQGVDEIIVLDTGSTDDTVQIAEALGAKVTSVGDRFLETPTQADIDTFTERYGWAPSFTTESRLFNYAAARNYSMSLASNDWCFCVDADEVLEWDIDKVRAILSDCDQLSYPFAFSNNPDGTPLLQFAQVKFLRKSKGRWVKKIHECVEGIPGSRMFYTEDLRLRHYQDRGSENRQDFLAKLEYAILETENDPRNTYYLAREYYYHELWDTAIKMFQRYLDLPDGWKPERSQAFIQMAECYKWTGRGEQAVDCYHRAVIEDDTRREPFYGLGMTYYEWAQYRSAAIYLRAALEVPLTANHYLNDMTLYTWRIWDLLSLVCDKLGETVKAQEAWLEAVKAAPSDQRILGNAVWFHRKGA